MQADSKLEHRWKDKKGRGFGPGPELCAKAIVALSCLLTCRAGGSATLEDVRDFEYNVIDIDSTGAVGISSRCRNWSGATLEYVGNDEDDIIDINRSGVVGVTAGVGLDG